MRAGTAGPGECVAPGPRVHQQLGLAPARPFPAISVSDQDIPSRCQIGGSAARDSGICSVSLSCTITLTYTHLTCPGQGSLFPDGPTWGPLTLLVGNHDVQSQSHTSSARGTSGRRRRAGPDRARRGAGSRGAGAAERARHPCNANDPRRDPDRRVPLASLSRRSRGDRVPRGGESLHPRRHAAHRGAAGAPLPGDAGPDQGDRSLGPRADRRLALLHPHRGRRAVSHLLPPARPSRVPARRSCWTRTSWRPGTTTSGWAPSRSAPTTGCWPIRWTPAAPRRSGWW